MNGFNPPPPGPNEPPPPYTETEAQSNTPPATSSSQNRNSQQPQQNQPANASQYFASRPSRGSHIQTYTISVRPNSLRDDYPYPREWAPQYDVSVQDWTTFVSFLIPDGSVSRDGKSLSIQRRHEVEGTIREWNDGFFCPRGVRVCLSDPSNPISTRSWASPNSWDRPPYVRPPRHTGWQPNPQPLSSRDRLTKKLKGVAADKDVSWSRESIRVGDRFSLSAGGLKIGKFALDENGMNYDGRPIGPPIAGEQNQHYRPDGLYPQYGSPSGFGHPHPSASQSGPPQGGAPPQYGGPRRDGASQSMYNQDPQHGPPPGAPPGHAQQQTGTTW